MDDSPSVGSGRFDKLPKLLLIHVLQFVEDLSSVAATSNLGRKLAEDVSTKRLHHLENEYGPLSAPNGDWRDWRMRLCARAIERIRRCYYKDEEDPNGGDKSTMPYPRLTSRLLISCAKETFVSQHHASDLHIAEGPFLFDVTGRPAAVLPGGDFAFFLSDNTIRIFNHRRGGFHTEHRAQRSSDLAPASSLSTLTYTTNPDGNEFLVLKTHRLNADSFSVWLKDGLSFVRDISPSSNFREEAFSLGSVVTQDDGTIYYVAQDRFKIHIEGYDVESGKRNLQRTEKVQGGKANPSAALQSHLIICGRKLLICRCVYDTVPEGTMGIYILDRDHPNTPLQYFPCFDQGGISRLDDERDVAFSQLWHPFRNTDEGADDGPLRAISLNEDVQQMKVVSELVQLGERKIVLYATDTQVYTSTDEACRGIVDIDVYDIASNKKVRTISAGLSNDHKKRYSLQYLLSNDEVLLCAFSSRREQKFVVQTFVL